MQDLVTDIIKRECRKILPEAATLQDLTIRRDSRFGLHVVTSPRFICTLKVTGHSDQPLMIKIFVKNRPNVNQECEKMRLLWRTHYARNQKYHIPEPLYIDEEHALLFLRYWPGESILSLFYRSAVGGRQRRIAIMEDYVRNAARWLVDFQDIHSSVRAKEIPSETLDFEAQLTTATYLTRTVRQRIIDKMRGLQESLPKLRETYVHDQYLFRNILYNNGEVCVFDFPHFRIGWPLYDFFTFYTGIERLKQYPFFSETTSDLMKSVFACTYFTKKGICYDAKVLENLWAFFIVGYVGKRYRHKDIGGIRRIVNNIFVKKMFGKLAKWSES